MCGMQAISAHALAWLHDQSAVEGGIFIFFSRGHLMLRAMESDVARMYGDNLPMKQVLEPGWLCRIISGAAGSGTIRIGGSTGSQKWELQNHPSIRLVMAVLLNGYSSSFIPRPAAMSGEMTEQDVQGTQCIHPMRIWPRSHV